MPIAGEVQNVPVLVAIEVTDKAYLLYSPTKYHPAFCERNWPKLKILFVWRPGDEKILRLKYQRVFGLLLPNIRSWSK